MQSYDYLIWEPSDYLVHHGIKGQEWGVKHGPPYPLESSSESKGKKKFRTDKDKSSDGKKKNDVSTMSDAELRKGIERARLEQQYRQLVTHENEKMVAIGKKMLKSALIAVGTQVLTNEIKRGSNDAISIGKEAISTAKKIYTVHRVTQGRW